MHTRKVIITILVTVFFSSLSLSSLANEVQPLMSKTLPESLRNQEAVMITVEMEPGESSSAHRHNAYVMVYMLSGKMEMQVKGGPLMQLEPGDTFFESPTDIHAVSRNLSDTMPAKFVVYLLKEAGAPAAVAAD